MELNDNYTPENGTNTYYPNMGGDSAGEQQGSYTPAAAPASKRKKRFPISGADELFAAVMTLLTVLFVVFGITQGAMAGLTVTFDLMFIAMSVYMTKKGGFPGIFGSLCGALTLVLSLCFSFTTDEWLNPLALLCMFCTSAVWFSSLAGRKDNGSELGLIGYIFSGTFPVILGNLFPVLASLFGERETGEKKKSSFGKVFAGVIAAIPVAALAVVLLTKADEAFSAVIGSAAENLGSLAAKFFGGLLLTPFVLAYAIGLKKTEAKVRAAHNGKGIDTSFTAAFLSVLSVCYLVYLFSQLSYFFEAFRGFLPENYSFSYAEYARRGFFELCGIAALNFAVLYLMLLVSRKQNGRLPAILKALGTFIAVFTLVIISTALAKMCMYIGQYGLTPKRIYTSAFMVFLAAVFISLILRLFTEKVKVIKVALVAAALVISALGITNVNAMISEYNYNFFTEGEGHRMSVDDLEDFADLGAEGLESLIKISKLEDRKAIAKNAEALIYTWYIRYGNYYRIEYYNNEIAYLPQKLVRINTGIGYHNKAYDKAVRLLEDFIAADPDALDKAENLFPNWY